MAEISVVWLLFLGVFMVVVSSGVLAASQWQNFSAVGQYAILFGYTVAFWIASLWTKQQQNLRLTSQMLQIATLLIIPVNFWVIDGFSLWRSGLGAGIGAIAALTLSAITWILLQPAPLLLIFNTLTLSWLQWGWAFPGFPLITTYVGTIGSALLLFYQFETRGERLEGKGVGIIAIAFSTLLLIGRAVLRAGVPLSQVGLALGVCGWLLCWLTRHHGRIIWTSSGIGLLVLGELVAVSADPPWQAIAVSGLGIWLLADRLKRLWQLQDLIPLCLIGLQAYCLLWRLIPVGGRRNIITLAIQLAGANLQSWELIGLAIFPYIVLMLVLAFRLRYWQQTILADYAEQMALILGIVLAAISLFHPLVRSLYLLFSSLTLAVVLLKRTSGAWLIYLTNITGLLTLLAWIGWGFSNLNILTWATILLICMVAEWSLNLIATNSTWRQSAWHLGLVLAALTYLLLLNQAPFYNLAWLVTPACLTFLASRGNFAQPVLASWLSVTALLLAQILIRFWIFSPNSLSFPSSLLPLLSLAVSTALMLVNTQKLQSLLAATITVGFGLSFVATSIWQIWGIPFQWLPTELAIAVWGLWLLRYQAISRNTTLSRIYAPALNGWAIAISILNLSILTLRAIAPLMFWEGADTTYIIRAAILTTSAIAYRLWQQPSNLGFYGIAWGIEIIVAVVVLRGGSLSELAIANLILGLLTQLSGEWRVVTIINYQLPITHSPYFSSWHVIPIIYAALGLLCAHNTFTATTGLYTLAAALTSVGVGRRKPQLKPLTYLSIAGISIAAYELLIYQLLQASGGESGDGMVLLAGLAGAIAITYRFLSRWLLFYWRLTFQELLGITHFHWAIGSLLALLSLWVTLSSTGSSIWIGVTAILAAYGIWQGRVRDNWVYVGVLEASGAIAYLLDRTLPESILVSWAAAIACLFAYALYILPWRSWGWSKQPWQRSAAILPISIVVLTCWGIGIQSLLLVAAFYAWLAKAENRIRLSYLSILLTDWAILRLLIDWNVSELLWYMTVPSGTLLYIAQVDPSWQSPSDKEKRHILRSLATGLFCLTAIYQSDPSLWQGILTTALGFALIIVGLTLRVRAFLYIGTLTFIIKVLRQLWLFINNYSLLLWALGIVVGLIFIWIAATFEARRSQAIALLQYWISELETWE
ncbi:MAG TPA: DUF2157 domain-containing protein [Cyanobacteria bacterium UBA11049]|nr:DUF2157 domain-containing protein [Cyanobacteria bacterium UBA11049]